MNMMGAAKFRAQCLAVMDKVQLKREPVLVTQEGNPVAKVISAETENDPLAIFRTGSFWSNGDLDNPPVVDPEEWKALR